MEDGGEHSPTTDDEPVAGRMRSGSAGSGHKRSLSGSLLSKLSFLRMSQPAEAPPPSKGRSSLDNEDDSSREVSPVSRAGGGSRAAAGGMAMAMQHQRRMRRRKGSLRKTALLGPRLDFKEKRSASLSPRSQEAYPDQDDGYIHYPLRPTSPDDELTPRGSIDLDRSSNTQSSLYWPRPTMPRGGGPVLNVSTDNHPNLTTNDKHNPVSPGETTTDDEDGMSLPRLNININNNPIVTRPSSGSSNSAAPDGGDGMTIPTPSSSSDSFFAAQAAADSSLASARQMRPTRSPLTTPSVAEIPTSSHHQDGWDYSETEWWGWIILVVTWLVFVVGIGSCFGVWSWSWDVGETPYAPPELEDDPTLPIVGYYPALMVLTAVMAWVWVVVAWVGMKYFKHANISGDDG